MFKPTSSFKPTTEQDHIVKVARTGKNIAIKAFAGAAKSTTLKLIAEDQLEKSFLYIAFAKSNVMEAEDSFPDNVKCQTMHSIAYRAIVKNSKSKFGQKLSQFFDFNDLDKLKASTDILEDVELKLRVMELVKLYCQSDCFEVVEFVASQIDPEKEDVGQIVSLVLEYWANLTNPQNTAKITHDVYLKLFQLTSPTLTDDRGQIYDGVFLDECQDSSPVILNIFLRQPSQRIAVGDDYQSIYAWRGAVNAFDNLNGEFEHLYLTESFRFTQEIADLATKLTSILGNDKRIIGRAKESNLLDQRQTKAIVVRNNSTLIINLLRAYSNSQKVYVIADMKDLWSKIYHVNALFFNKEPRYPNAELNNFKTFKELQEAAKILPELNKLIGLSFSLNEGEGLHANIQNIKGIIVDNQKDADIVIGTVFKTKGLEWHYVTIDEDILPTESDGKPLTGDNLARAMLLDQVGNSLYVALTRAKLRIDMPAELKNLLDSL
jgi:F-box protein 18 (helicase)